MIGFTPINNTTGIHDWLFLNQDQNEVHIPYHLITLLAFNFGVMGPLLSNAFDATGHNPARIIVEPIYYQFNRAYEYFQNTWGGVDFEPIEHINGDQSTHEISVHASIASSAKALLRRYEHQIIQKQQQSFGQWLSGATPPPSTLDLFSEWLNTLPSNQINDAAKRAFNWMKNSPFIESRSQVTLSKLLELVWLAANDPNETSSIDDRRLALVQALYESQRGYNLNETGVDNNQKDSTICLPGCFHKMISALAGGCHSLVNIIYVNKGSILLKANTLALEAINRVFLRLPIDAQTQYAKNWESPMPDDFIKDHIDAVKSELKNLIKAEFDTHKSLISGYDNLIENILNCIEDVNIPIIPGVISIRNNSKPLTMQFDSDKNKHSDHNQENDTLKTGHALHF